MYQLAWSVSSLIAFYLNKSTITNCNTPQQTICLIHNEISCKILNHNLHGAVQNNKTTSKTLKHFNTVQGKNFATNFHKI